MFRKIQLGYYALMSTTALLFNALLVAGPIIIFSLFKLFIPIKSVRFQCTSILQFIAKQWVNLNLLATKFISPAEIEIENNANLDKNGSYLIISNHSSWLDTLILQLTFHNKIAFPKFFMKFQMFYVPLIGLVCWALEFPAMRRYSKAYLAKNPDKVGEDIRRTKEYCSRLPIRPTTIINFVEGTRYNKGKAKKSDYENLLNPKAGGIAVILDSLSDRIDGILNTTIVYESHSESLWKFMCRQTKKIKIKVDFIPLSEISIGDYFNNEDDKKKFQTWLNDLWKANDQYISNTMAKLK